MTKQLVAALAPLTDRIHRGHCWLRTTDGPRRIAEPLDDYKLAQHVAQRAVYGACPIAPGESTTRLALLDFDDHQGALSWEHMTGIVLAVIAECTARGLQPIPFRSSGGQGIHLFFLWADAQDAYSVRQLLIEVLANALLTPGAGGVAQSQVEVFPKQYHVSKDGYGSMFWLPLAGQSTPLIAKEGVPLLVGARQHLKKETWVLSKPVPLLPKPTQTYPNLPTPTDHTTLHAALAAIPNNDTHSLDYDQWRNVIFALHYATDGSPEGLALAHEFSARSPKYDQDFLEQRVWPYIKSRRGESLATDGSYITDRTLYAMARHHGWQESVEDDFEILPPLPTIITKLERFAVLPALAFASLPPPHWIIKGVLPQADLGVIYGESSSGKSFFALDLVMSIARGVPWRGQHTQPGRVVYIAAEGVGGFRNRLKAYAHQYQLSLNQLPFGVIPSAPNFMVVEDIKQIIKTIRAFGSTQVIVVDTFARVTPGANENSGEDVGKVIHHCEGLHRTTGAMVLLIHHAGKDLTKGARGWSGLRAAADAEIEIMRTDKDRVATITKLKDGEDGATYGFRLPQIVIGQDAEGDDITSCYVAYTEVVKAVRKREPTGRLERVVWRAAHELMILSEGPIAVDLLITEALRHTPHEPGDEHRYRYNIKRAILTLADKGFVTIDDDTVAVP
jgi:hypothetical protein